MFTALIVGIAAAARVLGVGVDLQTKTAAATEHKAMEDRADAKLEKSLVRIEGAIEKLNDRIDRALVREGHPNARR
jgi:hypothetical protein